MEYLRNLSNNTKKNIILIYYTIFFHVFSASVFYIKNFGTFFMVMLSIFATATGLSLYKKKKSSIIFYNIINVITVFVSFVCTYQHIARLIFLEFNIKTLIFLLVSVITFALHLFGIIKSKELKTNYIGEDATNKKKSNFNSILSEFMLMIGAIFVPNIYSFLNAVINVSNRIEATSIMVAAVSGIIITITGLSLLKKTKLGLVSIITISTLILLGELAILILSLIVVITEGESVILLLFEGIILAVAMLIPIVIIKHYWKNRSDFSCANLPEDKKIKKQKNSKMIAISSVSLISVTAITCLIGFFTGYTPITEKPFEGKFQPPIKFEYHEEIDNTINKEEKTEFYKNGIPAKIGIYGNTIVVQDNGYIQRQIISDNKVIEEHYYTDSKTGCQKNIILYQEFNGEDVELLCNIQEIKNNKIKEVWFDGSKVDNNIYDALGILSTSNTVTLATILDSANYTAYEYIHTSVDGIDTVQIHGKSKETIVKVDPKTGEVHYLKFIIGDYALEIAFSKTEPEEFVKPKNVSSNKLQISNILSELTTQKSIESTEPIEPIVITTPPDIIYSTTS